MNKSTYYNMESTSIGVIFKSDLYIRVLCVFIFYFYVSFTMICYQAKWFVLYFDAK